MTTNDATDLAEVTIQCMSDGVWLTLALDGGKTCSINLSSEPVTRPVAMDIFQMYITRLSANGQKL